MKVEPVFVGGLGTEDLKFAIDLHIRREGYFVLIIQDRHSSACRGYTIGLSMIGEPELTMQGDEAILVYKFLHYLAHDVKHHQLALTPEQNIYWYGSILVFEEVAEVCRFAPEAARRYGNGIRLLEVYCPEEDEIPQAAPTYVIG